MAKVIRASTDVNINVNAKNADSGKTINKDALGARAVAGSGGTGSPTMKGMMGGMAGGAGANVMSKAGMAKGIAMNPFGAIMDQLPNMIMKHLPKMLLRAIPVIGWATLAIELVPMVVKAVVGQLTKAGSPFDKRFKRIMQQEQNAFFNREEQRRRQLGLSPVIITSVTGFVNNGGNNTVATLKQVKERGISDIGLQDKAIGLK